MILCYHDLEIEIHTQRKFLWSPFSGMTDLVSETGTRCKRLVNKDQSAEYILAAARRPPRSTEQERRVPKTIESD